ncbi:TRAP-type C4-dicarboxylate transport system, small permease component [Onishia taeanensis]|jgi:TRAP-type C4-dicarboxylate transport system permease small subunit|uniref:TRAP transporter small permease protein n=1 Tax=Onishia taeanensis TaxID=284577 RepID=A0A1G7QAE8_9GAMM|nr:TRAP transporter small permease subunit [Halomonas taeanensis]MAX32172.1 TRAP transporter permease DctQ [Halomonadaceae bacterium]SDF94560.1 TRAP-type C4-dicarboxylate transport system, small permease component [Halomonas taeanensis]
MLSLRSRSLLVSQKATLWLASSLLLIDLLAILFGVFMRYIAGGAPIWTDELARYLIIASVLLAMGAVWVEGGHMRVALIERLLPSGLCRLLNVYQWLLTLMLAIGGAVVSYRYAMSVSMFTSSGLGISRTIPMLSVPAGFALLAWQALLYGPAPLKTIAEEVE